MTPRRSALTLWVGLTMGALVVAGVAVIAIVNRPTSVSGHGLASNPNLDPGTPLSRPAPDFTLTDESGRRISLHSFRGRVVILAFADSECTTICPLTTSAMVEAKRLLGGASSQVQLLGVNANPSATATRYVRAYSEAHAMLHQWHFLTGSLPQLRHVWRAYNIAAQVEHGQIDHTPALYVIDQSGMLRKVYLTAMSYASIDQAGQLLAQEASSLLPGHPPVRASLSYSQIPPIGPRTVMDLPRAGGGSVRLGPGSPRLLAFFATWVSQTSDLAGQLVALNQYRSAAAAKNLPGLVAVDEGSVEPSASALPRFLRDLTRPLTYPVAIDSTGRVADGYEVQDQPWFVLVSPTGRILWYQDPSTSGWLTPASLIQHVRAAIESKPTAPATAASAQQELVGSPPPLAALHQQAGALLGAGSAFAARLRALRGYPIVVNAWASWCIPCRQEFGLFASASTRYGREVAFLGADTEDSPGDARSFLAQHPVSYPSYQTTIPNLTPLAAIRGLPTTIFLNRAGKVVYVHTGQYETQGTLDEDIDSHALGG